MEQDSTNYEPEKINVRAFGRWIKKRRETAELTQEQAARKARRPGTRKSLSTQYWKEIEGGKKHSRPSRGTVTAMVKAIYPDDDGTRLADALRKLGYPPDESLGGNRGPAAKYDQLVQRSLQAVKQVVLTAQTEAEAHVLFAIALRNLWREKASRYEWRGALTDNEKEGIELFISFLPWFRAEHLRALANGILRGLDRLQEAEQKSTEWLLTIRDFVDARTFVLKLKRGRSLLSRHLKGRLRNDTLILVKHYNGNNVPDSKLMNAIVRDLNAALRNISLYEKRRFKSVYVSAAARDLMALKHIGNKLILLNRILLENAYHKEILPRANDSFYLSPHRLHEDVEFQFDAKAGAIVEGKLFARVEDIFDRKPE